MVTGGSRGLGAAIAEALSWAGASVAIMSRDGHALAASAEAIRQATGGTVIDVPGDVSDDGDVESAVERIVTDLGGLGILVNAAGINVRGPIEDIVRSDFEHSVAVNLTGAWALCKAAAPYLKSSGHGRVINISSILGVVGAADRTVYAATKGAMVQLTRALAMEWAGDGVTINTIAPGPFLTDMNIALQYTPPYIRVIEHEVAMKRWGEIHEIQGAALYLASDASSYVTGAVLPVDGGWTAH